MILNSTKLGGNRTKHVEVGLDRQTERFLYTPPNYVCGGYNKIVITVRDKGICKRNDSSLLYITQPLTV
jgi:hypothetical protein